MPSPKSRGCWKPAVPPPPVAGALAGNGLGVAEGLGVGRAGEVAAGLADALALAPGVAEGAGDPVAPGEVGTGEPVAPGEIDGGDAEDGDPEQAGSAAAANMMKAAQPATVNLCLRPVAVMVLAGSSLEYQATRLARPGKDARPGAALRTPRTQTISSHSGPEVSSGGRTGGKVILSRRLPDVAVPNWRVARRLIILVAIPTVLGLALTGMRVTDEMRSANAYRQVSTLALLGQQVTVLAQAMEDERAETAAFITSGRLTADLAALHRGYRVTDRSAATTRRLVLRLGGGYPAQTRASAAAVLASIAELPGLRKQAAGRQAPALAVIDSYSAAIAGLFSMNEGIADLSGNSALATSVRALDSLSRMTDQAAQQQAILAVALAERRIGAGTLTALTTARAQQASDLVSFRNSASAEESWALTDTLARPVARQARSIEQSATANGDGALILGPRASQEWRAGMSYTVIWMRAAEAQLAGWITAYSQALQRSAARSAMITGGAALGALIVILLVTLIIARSLVLSVRRLEAAALRGDSVSTTYAGFFRRSHSLLERLLRQIDSLELSEDDPQRLATLFEMDHLATRLRRNSDTTQVLVGQEARDHRTEPVTLVDVLRAAVSEIEQYGRVTLDAQQGVSVSGSAAADVAHLLAELLDNATAFSPETAQVFMSGHTVRGGGLLISITDSGPGMRHKQLRHLNRRLAHSGVADVRVSPQLGLFAVAQLAARSGIKVELCASPGGGTTAEVTLPPALTSPDALAGGLQGRAGEALRARASRPEIATADAALVPLGAPVPAADAAPAAGELTSAGLPQRIPRAGRIPVAAVDQETRQATAAEAAQIAVGRLASFQRGSRRARAVTQLERGARQSSQDD
jgi:signal transduction histidine kinase